VIIGGLNDSLLLVFIAASLVIDCGEILVVSRMSFVIDQSTKIVQIILV